MSGPISLRALLGGPPELPDLPVTGLASDSRAVRPGDLFLALRGERHHGLEFLPAVRAAGAAAVLWEPPFAGAPAGTPELPVLPVEGLSQRVGPLASRFYGEPSHGLTVIGVTGTDGKTSVAHFIAQALHGEGDPCGILGTLGYGVYGDVDAAAHTTPDALALQRWLARLRARGVRRVVMEVSSHALAQGRVGGVRYDVAVLTHVSRDHLDYHGDVAAYAAAKRRLFIDHAPRVAVLNLDDRFGRELVGLGGYRSIGYGLAARRLPGLDANLWGEGLAAHPGGLRLRVRSIWGEGPLETRLLGRFNASNLLAALGVLFALDLPFDEAMARIARVSPVPGRMECLGGGRRPLVVVDYAHTPHALAQVLAALREHATGRLWCVFGCGGDRDPGKRPLMGEVAERLADRVVLTDDNPRTEDPDRILVQIRSGMAHGERAGVQRDRAAAIAGAIREAGAGDVVLIAGKGHEDYQIVGERRLDFSDRDRAARSLREARA